VFIKKDNGIALELKSSLLRVRWNKCF